MQLADRYVGGRALVLGRSADFSAIPNLSQYFNLVVAEDPAYVAAETDVTVWQTGSPYSAGRWAFPEESDQLIVANLLALRKMEGSSMSKRTYNLAYLPGGDISSTPSIVKGLPIGLDPLFVGAHLARISGCTEIYDTESRSGTLPGMPADILAKIATQTKMGTSAFFLAPRFPLLEQL
jgi:hypothetical protein